MGAIGELFCGVFKPFWSGVSAVVGETLCWHCGR